MIYLQHPHCQHVYGLEDEWTDRVLEASVFGIRSGCIDDPTYPSRVVLQEHSTFATQLGALLITV